MLDVNGLRELGPDEKITEPGFYIMPLERHHNQPCDGVSVTSSTLRTIEIGTPADVWAFHPANPNRWVRRETSALRLGRAMASFVEAGADGIKRDFLILPDKKPNRPTMQQITAYKEGRATEKGAASVEFWAQVEADPRDPLTTEEFEMICDMGGVIAADPAAQAALGGIPEVTMAWQDERTGIWCLARPDQVSFDGMLSDYKRMATTGGPFSTRAIDNRITQHGYDMQMAFAAEGFERLTGEWPGMVGLVFQYADPPHHVVLREIAEEDLRIAQFRNRRSLDRFKECWDSGHWPGPGDEVGVYHRPQWQRDMLLEDMQTAGVAP